MFKDQSPDHPDRAGADSDAATAAGDEDGDGDNGDGDNGDGDGDGHIREPPLPPLPLPPETEHLLLQHPLEGLEQWSVTHPHDFAYAFLDDAGTKETQRLDAAELRRRTVEVRDALLRFVEDRERQRRDVAGHRADTTAPTNPTAAAANQRSRPPPLTNQISSLTSPANESPPISFPPPILSNETLPPPLCVLLVFPPGLDFLPVLLGAMAAGVVALPAYPPDPTASTVRFKQQLTALHNVAAAAGVEMALTTRVYAAALQISKIRVAARDALTAICKFRPHTWLAPHSPEATASWHTNAGDSPGGGESGGGLRWMSTEQLIGRGRAARFFSTSLSTSPYSRLPSCYADDSPLSPPDAANGVAFVQYTSGSTSSPKGVCVGHRQLSHNCALIRRQFGIVPSDVEVSWLPQYHDMGLVGAYLTPLTIAAGYYHVSATTSSTVSSDRMPLVYPAHMGKDNNTISPPLQSATTTSARGKTYRALRPIQPAPATCVFLSPTAFMRDPIVWARVMSKYRATMTQAPDFAYRLCAERFAAAHARASQVSERGNSERLARLGLNLDLDLSALRHCLNAAERINPDTSEHFAAVFAPFGFTQSAMSIGYGLAESVVYVCDGGRRALPLRRSCLEMHKKVELCGADSSSGGFLLDRGSSLDETSGAVRWVASCGAPCAEVSLIIVNPETRLRLPESTVGEIWLRSDSVAVGYWNPGSGGEVSTINPLLESGSCDSLMLGSTHQLCGTRQVSGLSLDNDCQPSATQPIGDLPSDNECQLSATQPKSGHPLDNDRQLSGARPIIGIRNRNHCNGEEETVNKTSTEANTGYEGAGNDHSARSAGARLRQGDSLTAKGTVFGATLADHRQGISEQDNRLTFLRTGDEGFLHGGELFLTGRFDSLGFTIQG